MGNWVIGVVALVFSVVGVQGLSVHFNLTTGDCSNNSTVVNQCNALYITAATRAQRLGTLTPQRSCMLFTETLACVETALCHCNFSSTHPQLRNGFYSSMLLHHFYNNVTKCHNVSQGDSIQGEVTQPINVTEGVNCTQYNRTAGDLALSLAVAQLAGVQAADALCPGIQACYYQFDRGLEVALYRKNWPEYCHVSLELLQCMENASCQCGKTSHEVIVNMVNNERKIYRDTCNTIRPTPIAQQVTITCRGSDICSWQNPHFNCEKESAAARRAAKNPGDLCQAIYNLANCTEALACQCGFYNNSVYYLYLAQSKHEYTNLSCETKYAAFPNHAGLNCGQDDRFTEAEKILTISLGELPAIAQADSSCSGIKKCYDIADPKTSEAHRMKDLTAICQVDSELLRCDEMALCNCGLLNERSVSQYVFERRIRHIDICYGATGLPLPTRCRGLSTCRLSLPLSVCVEEYSYDTSFSKTKPSQCRAVKNYITCTEDVACACGMLREGTTPQATLVYNITTLFLKVYDEGGCPDLTGGIFPKDDGINCPASPGDDQTKRKLALFYADSAEVAALSEKCSKVKDCFKLDDDQKAEALFKRNYQQLCQVQSSLIGCVDKAYCKCGLNGTAAAERFIATEMSSHKALCSSISTPTRQPCKRETSTATISGLSVALMMTTLLTSALMTP
ncbi:hypothetical protein ACOMHN_036766 [Nucella lapillus]